MHSFDKMEQKCLRSPICTVLGHVDHGKSSILDSLRGTAIVAGEAGAITQAIGASIIPLAVIQKACGELMKQLKIDIKVPGLLFIDTPGHAAFTSLRKRGGNLADIAVVVVDINEGFKPQTVEAIEILRQSKTPFIIAANKIDLIPGFKSHPQQFVLKTLQEQQANVLQAVENKMYTLVGSLYEKFNIESERFDRVDDYTKKVAIVPVSAKTSDGMNALLMVLLGLAQRYLESSLKLDVSGPAKGTILEVKEVKGLGLSIDVIIYDGILRRGDTIVIGNQGEPIVTKVRALLEPEPLAEMRDKKSKFKNVDSVSAATGVKICALDLDNAVAGMPLRVADPKDVERVKEEIGQEVKEVLLKTDEDGVIIKADTLGSLEAMMHLFREHGIKIRKASIGAISKKDIADAESNYEKDPFEAVILGFNVKVTSDIASETTSELVKVITNDVIYRLVDDYQAWKNSLMKVQEAQELDVLVRPGKLEIMRGYVFRQSNPAVCGCHITAGRVKTGVQMMKDGHPLTTIRSIQKEKESITVAQRDEEVAIGFDHIMIGRQVHEGDFLYTFIPEDHFRKLKDLKKLLQPEEIEILKDIAIIMRKQNPVWGV